MATVRTYGIDVSYHQGVIDWSAVKAAGVEWVILRAGYGFNTVDTKFINNITGAIAAGFDKIGAYWFSYAYDSNSAKTEVESFLAAVAPYKENITLPLFFDWEEASFSYVQKTEGRTLTANEIRNLARVWNDAITAAGYDYGIYANKSNASGWFKNSDGSYLWEELNCEFWYARYGANNETSLFITPAFEATALSEHPEMSIFQYADVGQISGINSNRVDLNIRYTVTTDPEPPTPPEPSKPIVVLNDEQRHGIEYVEIRNEQFSVLGIIDAASSIIWRSVYYGVGDFEIYARATPDMLQLLQENYYVTRPDNDEVGIIESINISDNPQDGKMITASGRFAKSILDRRLIYNLSGTSNTPSILSGNVETSIRSLVTKNAINCPFDVYRNIAVLELGASAGISKTIVDENGNAAQKQVSYQNLLEYTDEVLQEYKLSSKVLLDRDTGKLQFVCFEGTDRSVDNAAGLIPVIFSKEFDNLLSSEYKYETAAEKNTALIGGEGEGIDRFYALLSGSNTGLARRELWVDANSINKTYKDDNDVEQTYTDAQYAEMLKLQGKQELAPLTVVESLDGNIDVTNGNYVYKRDFSLGDIVTVQDNEINKYINVRIVEVVECQDSEGYTLDVKYGNVEENVVEYHAAVLLAENNETLLAETGEPLLLESAAEVQTSGKKISELDETSKLQDGCCFPLVTSGETKKINYKTLKEQLNDEFVEKDPTVSEYIKEITEENIGGWNNKLNSSDTITNEEIDAIMK